MEQGDVRPMPIRTCIACKHKADPSGFLRVSRGISGGVALFAGHGRSAYLCRAETCIQEGLKKGRLDRALKSAITDFERLALKDQLLCQLR